LFRLIIIFFSLIILGGCSTHRVFDFTVISTKDFNFSDSKSLHISNELVRVESDGLKMYFLIPDKLNREDEIESAVEEAINSTPGAVALANGTVFAKQIWAFPFYVQHWFEVEGKPLIQSSEN